MLSGEWLLPFSRRFIQGINQKESGTELSEDAETRVKGASSYAFKGR
jgi:hypothetical protein